MGTEPVLSQGDVDWDLERGGVCACSLLDKDFSSRFSQLARAGRVEERNCNWNWNLDCPSLICVARLGSVLDFTIGYLVRQVCGYEQTKRVRAKRKREKHASKGPSNRYPEDRYMGDTL
jgi:hypothetical protein